MEVKEKNIKVYTNDKIKEFFKKYNDLYGFDEERKASLYGPCEQIVK